MKMVIQALSCLVILGFPLMLTIPSPCSAANELTSVTRSSNANWSYGNRAISYSITVEAISNTPAWADPSHELPPLSMSQAVAVSRQDLSRYVPEVSEWTLKSISLELFDEPDRWFYVITWQPFNGDVDHQLHIPVLMNGDAVTLKWEVPVGERKKR